MQDLMAAIPQLWEEAILPVTFEKSPAVPPVPRLRPIIRSASV
jgi:hypothetical protein